MLRQARLCLSFRVVLHQSIPAEVPNPACELAHKALICIVVWAKILSESAHCRHRTACHGMSLELTAVSQRIPQPGLSK